MADREQVQVLLRDLGGLVGLPELGLDADGHCSLVFDGRVEVDLAYAEGDDRLTVAALLGRLPVDAPAERYLELLDANFFWRGTEGATLGVERDSGTVVLLEALPLAGLDIGGLERHLDVFVATAETWVQALAAGGGAADGQAAIAPAGPGFMIRARPMTMVLLRSSIDA